MILLFKATTGGGSMRRGYDTTARRPSTRYCLHLLVSLNIKTGYDEKSNSHGIILLADLNICPALKQGGQCMTSYDQKASVDRFIKKDTQLDKKKATKTV